MPVARRRCLQGPVVATPAFPPVVSTAWEQAHIDSWTADRIPRPDLEGEVHVATRSAPWTPDTNFGEPRSEADRVDRRGVSTGAVITP